MIEGRLTIDLYRNGSGVEHVEINSTRPLRIARVFEGKTPQDVAKTLPLLFSVCAAAQARAGTSAMEEALGVDKCPITEAARSCLVLAETAREHLFRIVMDWPRYTGEEMNKEQAKRITSLVPDFKKALFKDLGAFEIGGRAQPNVDILGRAIEGLDFVLSEMVFGEEVKTWLNRSSFSELFEWASKRVTLPSRLTALVIGNGWESEGDIPVSFLPEIPACDIVLRLKEENDRAFSARPEWDGLYCETSSLSRQCEKDVIKDLLRKFGSGLLTRIAARLSELADTVQKINSVADTICKGTPLEKGRTTKESGEGLAQVEAARGRLIHHVLIENNLVSSYQIVAPTEWNFHPSGVAVNGLRHLKGKERDLKKLAHLFIESIDPCVGYELRVH